jgi:hypothetical protein
MHAYERDLHLILTSRPWSLYGSALMETALKPNLQPSSFNAARNERMASDENGLAVLELIRRHGRHGRALRVRLA